jgi:menaquinone-dependent protoporphyrinogen oxidase
MLRILVAYATRTGHTRRVAQHVAAFLSARGEQCELTDAAHMPAGFTLTSYSAAIFAASLHIGRFEVEMRRLIQGHRSDLQRLPSVFLPVSLAQATIDDPEAPPQMRSSSEEGLRGAVRKFLDQTGWQPADIIPVAGALSYTKYGFFIRLVMKRISAKAGGPTDTSRDHEFTDWDKLDKRLEELLPGWRRSHSEPTVASTT